ncbi:hypothetical protein TNCV_3544851 [Trichonephila clavipes]|nr:hypothetical protein TNCV_3544851 [Trichonephila clavipes]
MLFLMPPDLDLIPTHEVHHGKRLVERLSLAVDLSNIQVTVRFSSVSPQFRGKTLRGGGQGPPSSLPLPSTSREDLRVDGYLEYPHAAKALYICKHMHVFSGIRAQGPRHCSQRR